MLSRKNEEFKSVDQSMHYFSKEVEEKMEEPLVWVAVDEAHELLPREGKTAASDALITILREGRQPGISLILATQQPAKIHTDVITQADVVIAHKLTAQMDIEALGGLMQSYMRSGLDAELAILPPTKGAAIIFDDANERMFPVQMRPRFTWHGGGSPTAIKEKKDFYSQALKRIKML
jgi:DNA helicase HerA-like ATPase